MNNIQKSIRVSALVMCLICCAPYLATGATLAGTSPEQLIAHVRAQHFGKYPASEGYPTIGEALGKFFANGVWKYEMKNYPGEVISFTGIAKSNGKNAHFKCFFSIITTDEVGTLFPFGTVMQESIFVNDTRVTEKERGDIMAAVMLN